MPQEFQVLQCYSCQTFQVHQVKKAKKWACKMCGEKQSIIKVYGRGTGAECRQHVQTLNTHRGEMDLLKETLRCNEGFQEASNYPQYNNDDDDDRYSINVQESGKWNQFVEDDPGNVENDDDDDDFDDGQFTTDASLLSKRGKSRKRKRETEFQHKPKTNRFNSFYDQTADDDQYNDSVTRPFTSQGCRWTDNSSDHYSTNVDEDQSDEYNSMTKFGTKSNRDKSYKKQNVSHYGNIKPHTTSKWSSFGEASDQRRMDEHIIGVTAKPRNSSFNQAGVTRFCNNTDRIDCTETYQPKMSKWSSFGGNSGQQIMDEPAESYTNGDRQATSKWNVYEEHSSQLSSDNDPASQDNGDNRETDTRIYVEFRLPDKNAESNHSVEMPQHNDIRTNDRNTQGACNNLANYTSNLNKSANQGSRHKSTVNTSSRNSQANTVKQTSSKWGQFLGGDSEEENFEESDHTSVPDIPNSSTLKVDNFTDESVTVGRDVDDKVHVMSSDRRVLGDRNVPLKRDLSKTLAYNRHVPRLNDGTSNSKMNTKIPDLDSKPFKDCGSKVIQNKVDKSNAVVVNKNLDVNSLFSTGDFSDDDFEL